MLKKSCVVVLTVLALTAFSKEQKAEKSIPKLSQNSNICQFQPNGALLQNPENCRKFYLCVQRQSFEYNCSPDYYYDAITRRCVEGKSCNSAFIAAAACKEGSIRPVQDNCNVFEACVRGKYEKLTCPSNYYFNVQKSMCVPFKYDAEFKCNCLMPEYTVLENENNCETYLVCHQKSVVMEYCPLGQYYNAKLNTCIIDLEGVCLMKPTITSVHANQDKNDFETACRNLGLKNINFETFPKACNTFYTCVNGKLFTQHCPKDYYYDSNKKYCTPDVANKCLNTGFTTNEI